ncbi:hypothetical protein [Candidatus Rhabdochlamydia sp. T3358]|uniref:hypothetical protein n=1 Tax=Candidatus Rhabdochlamydia sp. T3358 TaxID=2099795 RepID=UPI0010B140A1|nr:hypothetical protein [Candidatus Rhabdochlamydia sp. T3358]VHN99712.1 hypothetical protein RHT_00118 [Candidatus Rhabdochlamydia sp. T3358]
MTTNIKTALHQAQTYKDLFSIADKLCAGLSSWGYQYASVTPQSSLYHGTIAIGAVAEKALKIRQGMEKNGVKFTPEEKRNISKLSKQISHLYTKDIVNCKRADRLTTLCRFVMNILFWVNHHSKWPSYEKQLQQPLSISLKTAVNKAQNYQELLPIANELHAGLSWWGYQYAYVPTSTSIDKEVIYKGRIATGATAKKALKIIQEMDKNKMGFTENEADCALPFCKKIYCLYVEDNSLCNQANWLTAIFRSVVRVIFWTDHQSKWGDILPTRKYETYPDIICKKLTGSIGGWTEAFEKSIFNWEDQGATYIPFPNGL